MKSLKQFASGPRGQNSDHDSRSDRDHLDSRWDRDHSGSAADRAGDQSRWTHGGCGDHQGSSAIHKEVVLPVAPTATSGSFDLHAVLDSPGPTDGRPLMILVSGFTYDHEYWDPPVGSGKYSFVDAANRAGYATLNLDRLGSGSSDRPPSDLTTIQQQADELHQIIQSVKNGDLSSYGFSKIVLVGHSLGSAIAQTEVDAYGDVDALVLTGFRHAVDPVGVGQFISAIHPADDQPAGYLTVDNRDMFYDLSKTSGDLLAWDASHIGTGTGPELDVGYALDPLRSDGISVPVLQVVGEHDLLFLTDPSTFAAEQAFYANSSDFEQLVVKNAGHNVTLAKNATQTFDQILDFVEDAVPVNNHHHHHHHHDLLA